MKAMNTDGTLTGYSTTASFVNALKKNIKINKVCTDDVTKCFSKEIIWNEGEEPIEVTNTAVTYDDTQGQDWAETVGVQFANGVTALLAYNKNCTSDPFNNQFAASAACIGIIYDVSANKNPNASGKDIAFNANVGALGGNSGCAFEYTDANGTKVCFSKILGPQNGGYSGLSNADCTKAKEDGKIDTTYCYNGNDYYAGAVLACGGKKANLPTMAQLGLLATYLYNHDSIIGAKQDISSGLTLDTEKAQSFLAQSPYGSDTSNPRFSVWSSEEFASSYAYTRYFNSGYTYYDSNLLNRDGTSLLAVCLGE